MMKYVMQALRFKIFMLILLGLAYPLAMTGVAQILFPRQASGDFLSRGGQMIGSKLIAQNFEKNEYFWPRPSAVGYNPLPSGGSNLGPTSEALVKLVQERRTKLMAAHAEQAGEPPQDLLFASGSGLDPHISLEAASYQLQRVAKARKLSPDEVGKLITQATQERQWGLFGEATVNVLALNLSLDQAQGLTSNAPPPASPTQ